MFKVKLATVLAIAYTVWHCTALYYAEDRLTSQLLGSRTVCEELSECIA